MASSMRIGGLASGMDIDTIVSDLMKAERVPLDKLTQKKQYLEWQRDDFREINKMMLSLDTMIFEDLILSDTYNQKTVSISDSNEVAIKNVSSASDFSGTINVKKLATAAMIVKSNTGVTDSSKKISDIFSNLAIPHEITVQAIKKDGTLDDGFKISFNPVEETLESLIAKINEQTGVTMFFDTKTGGLSVSAKNTGDVAGTDEIVLSGDLFTKLGLDTATKTAGVNAEFTYNGITTTRSSNTFTINGFEISLKNANNKDVTFSSTADVDKITEKIVKFVDEYNKLIEKLNTELNEKKYRDYQPLTSEQKEAMEEKEIELWEEKARSGTLRNDSALSSALNKMRTDFYSPISGISGLSQLAEIGITTTANYMDGGKLTIDEKKLKEAIANDPNAVRQLFAKEGTETGDKGIARRLRDTLKSTMDTIEQKAGKATSVNTTFSLGRNLDSIEDQIDRFQERLIQIEDRYWRQFTAMEKAIQQANTQSAYITQQFSM
ncbi:flagellar hook-associated protein 2 [Robertmurraya kyonggiensis]|uniref:Flagellar hook-associated protein 2 n=1 Tax=Robertmurraya kyonggiensis TaxID=1037680 RepID=A0A4U1D5V8_9BACI|nr:flagellar hook-associated protein 2 [Robertmurraya kyonggiensis]TKC17043.1 flagellar hook-associated protein 2 [Robertmurraya kyonggiensis]